MPASAVVPEEESPAPNVIPTAVSTVAFCGVRCMPYLVSPGVVVLNEPLWNTSNFAVGLVVPIPTLPVGVNINPSVFAIRTKL
jgi:hypothetical protein